MSVVGYKYKYNGKELQDELNLNLYDYGARNYDPAIGRFITMDVLSALTPGITPYHYVLNNPVSLIDPTGMWTETKDGYTTSDSKEIKDFLQTLNPVQEDKKDVKDLSTSQDGVDFIKDYEKLETNLYTDATGNATIGYGHLVHFGKVGTNEEKEKEFKKGITKEKAEELLMKDIKDKAEKYIKLYVTVQLTQNQFDGLVGFTYNVGGGALKSSSLLKKINAGETSAAVIETKFKLWNKGTVNGERVELKGLTTRRGQEANIYNYENYDSTH